MCFLELIIRTNIYPRVWVAKREGREGGSWIGWGEGRRGGIYYLKENNKNQLLNYSLVCQKCV